ncbi:PoNi-like cognate immunity protein [Clostridium saccharobutylicum]|uniref:PoNi C-terminal domain-containing protein n=1 Tax=Clostridium saccharobutylicum TaxID=169679 RepID=A0A1S8MT70_CLOSA|nr:PoNi-like cognate immunity protein [Clostridium saccharobutylicum]OOM07376.1 hypothetical protein CLOSAC_39050 [Clostridium saccharobutylicum]
MRDNLCMEKESREGIEYNEEFIDENREDIKNLKEDIKNNIQRSPKDNKSIIEARHLRNYIYIMENIRAKYSIGQNINTLEEDFINSISDLENIGNREVGYLNLLWMISLGILLETDKENIIRLSKLVDKENIEDAVIDYLLCASDIGWNKVRGVYDKENPYSKTKEIIELAEKDKSEASKRMQKYMEKEWFKGHYDYGWKNAHKEPGYVGFWSFETAALAKILGIDDASLKENNHYPYDLAHYKDTMKFKQISISKFKYEDESKNEDVFNKRIENNYKLEKIIPIKWHSFINELIHDYQELPNSRFYEKYKKIIGLDQIWFLFDEYQKENQGRNLLGSLIVFAMTREGYILQLDYKEDLEDYYSNIKNYWNNSETKLIRFVLDNDQNYYALVPKDADVEKMYEVDIVDVK